MVNGLLFVHHYYYHIYIKSKQSISGEKRKENILFNGVAWLKHESLINYFLILPIQLCPIKFLIAKHHKKHTFTFLFFNFNFDRRSENAFGQNKFSV